MSIFCFCSRNKHGGLSLNGDINPIVYVLVERTERELDSKLLTALCLLKRGFHVMLGFQWALAENRDCLPTGIFFFKGMNNLYNQWMAKVRQFGHIVIASEEELLDECIDPPDVHCHFDEKYRKNFYFSKLFQVFYLHLEYHCESYCLLVFFFHSFDLFSF